MLARLRGLDHHHVDVAAEQRRDALAAAGKEMNAQRAPLERCSSCRTTLSRLVTEPPDCFSWPGFSFAAVVKSGGSCTARRP
jgi:hypothetical protein